MKRINILSLLLIVSTIIFTNCSEKEEEISENPDPSLETGVFTDSRDGNAYNWVKIGDQTWMTDNLKFKVDSGCWAYNSDESLVDKYGYLYNWEVANDTNTLPDGWHIPTRGEWELLLDTLSKMELSVDTSFTDALAKSMTSADSWLSSLNYGCPGSIDNNELRNRTHFSALASGVMYADTTFGGEGYFGNWWTADGRVGKAYFYRIANGRTNVMKMKESQFMGLSIRCIKDEDIEE